MLRGNFIIFYALNMGSFELTGTETRDYCDGRQVTQARGKLSQCICRFINSCAVLGLLTFRMHHTELKSLTHAAEVLPTWRLNISSRMQST